MLKATENSKVIVLLSMMLNASAAMAHDGVAIAWLISSWSETDDQPLRLSSLAQHGAQCPVFG